MIKTDPLVRCQGCQCDFASLQDIDFEEVGLGERI